MAPFVGLGSTMLVPSLLKALPALKASTISDSRMDIGELCGAEQVERELRDRLRDASVMTSKSASVPKTPTMQYDDFSIDEAEGPTWGVRSPRDGDLGLVKDTLRKEQVIKSVLSASQMFCFGFYLLAQGDLSLTRGSQGYAFTTYAQLIVVEKSPICNIAMLAKVQAVQREVDKLTSGNETLQMYIDNLTVQMAKRR